MKEVLPDLEAESSKKCRWFLISAEQIAASENARKVFESWIQESLQTTVPASEYKSLPGIYGWNKIDHGSQILISTLPDLQGVGADLGSGYGYLSHQVLLKNSGVSRIHLVEADSRALICARHNLETSQDRCHYHWLDVTALECRESLPPLDWILMNPPFHEGALVDHNKGKEFIETASALLKPGGQLYLVANAFLAYEDLLKALFKNTKKVLTQEGFKVCHVER